MKKSDISVLVGRAKNGDRSAFEMLYNEFRDRIYFFAKRTVGNGHAAEDVTSETFVTVFEKLPTLRENESFVGWIYNIAYCKIADHIKSEAHMEYCDLDDENALDPYALSEPLVLPEDYAVNEDIKRCLGEIIDALTPDQRSAVMLYYFEDQSVPEIAKAHGTTESSVFQMLYRARKSMRKGIEKLIGDGALLAAVPLEAMLHTLSDSGYVRAGAGAVKVAGNKFALKLLGVGTAAVMAVGVPIMAQRLYGGGGYRPDESIVTEPEITESKAPAVVRSSLNAGYTECRSEITEISEGVTKIEITQVLQRQQENGRGWFYIDSWNKKYDIRGERTLEFINKEKWQGGESGNYRLLTSAKIYCGDECETVIAYSEPFYTDRNDRQDGE